MAADDRSTNFKDLLLYFAENISDSDFRNMKFRYDGQISRSRLERITHPAELFSELQSRRIIGIDKIDELKKLVKTCLDNRQQFIDAVIQFEQKKFTAESIDQSSSVTTPTHDLQKETELLTYQLGRNWKFFFRHIDLEDSIIYYKADENRNNLREAIYACLQYWLTEKASGKTDEEIRKAWITALERLNRNDLAHQLESIKNNQWNSVLLFTDWTMQHHFFFFFFFFCFLFFFKCSIVNTIIE